MALCPRALPLAATVVRRQSALVAKGSEVYYRLSGCSKPTCAASNAFHQSWLVASGGWARTIGWARHF